MLWWWSSYVLNNPGLCGDLVSVGSSVSPRPLGTSYTIDGTNLGKCNPDGADYDCTFFECYHDQAPATMMSSTGILDVNIRLTGHSKDCDCDKSTWECSQENTVAGRAPMSAVGRFTLVPLQETSTSS